MKYPWLAITIVIIWLMAAYTILARDAVKPDYIIGIAIAASLILGIWGLRAPK
ncbi:MAG: hypothetical protein HYY55_03495 [Candidatus Niyogibacteria bacterium]|nr:MAG: hypothetical protein HYY55_03495 [Candidatus Niyogibacteria bacterium]